MNTQLVRSSVRFGIAACVILTFVPWAPAALIVPGQTAFAVPEPDPLGGVLIAGGVPVPFASATFTGTLTSSVIAGDVTNPFGGLTFTYLLVNNPASSSQIGRFTINGFAGFLTDLSYQFPPVGLPPTLNDRSILPGDVVGFSFIGPPVGPGPLLPG